MPRLTAEVKIWFDLPDDPDHGRVEIRAVSEVESAAIAAKATKTRMVYDPALAQVVREQGYDLLVDRQETMVGAVCGWENFFDQDGKAMTCTAAAKRQWACNQEFFAYVRGKLDFVNQEAKRLADEKRKNS